eukprot:15443110-Alexandrium_andersonii.AAC.1
MSFATDIARSSGWAASGLLHSSSSYPPDVGQFADGIAIDTAGNTEHAQDRLPTETGYIAERTSTAKAGNMASV